VRSRGVISLIEHVTVMCSFGCAAVVEVEGHFPDSLEGMYEACLAANRKHALERHPRRYARSLENKKKRGKK
jgi:hypothetical protein